MVLLGGTVVSDVRVPERVNGWLTAGLMLLVVMVMVGGLRVPTTRLTEAALRLWAASPSKMAA